MNRKLKRSTLAAIEDWWNGNQGGGREAAPQQGPFNPGAVFLGVNAGNSVIMPGDRVTPLSLCPSSISYANAVKKLLNNKLKLYVRKWASGDAEENASKVLTPAAPNHICQFKDVGANFYFGHIYIPDLNTAYDYVDSSGVATNTEADAFAYLYRACMTVDNATHYAVALCEKTPAGGKMTPQEIRGSLNTTSGTFLISVSVNQDAITFSYGTALTSLTAAQQ